MAIIMAVICVFVILGPRNGIMATRAADAPAIEAQQQAQAERTPNAE